ncbi:hypothetical protein T484DRAFT_1924583 [Baffinella frigidus]|nr:hypothetical protein T484DRAFT_1924583 [Cryptophyta sp. CCMP2293]
MARMQINPDWLEDTCMRKIATCPLCFMVMDQATVFCRCGETACRRCLLEWLPKRQNSWNCPACLEPNDVLVPNGPFEGIVGKMRLRCKNGPEADDDEGAPSPSFTVAMPPAVPNLAQVEPAESTDDEDVEPAEQWCVWRGMVRDFEAHLAECAYEPVPCSNVAAGCTEIFMRKDAAVSSICLPCRRRYGAFAMGHHERLGAGSRVLCLDAGVVRMILDRT